MRVLVSGSRSWEDWEIIWKDLDELAVKHGDQLVLIHGDCPLGADRHARNWFNERAPEGSMEHRYPAAWTSGGQFNRAAGFIRNQLMVDTGPDLALFYIHDNSRGTEHCMRMVRAAKIPRRIRRHYGTWELL